MTQCVDFRCFRILGWAIYKSVLPEWWRTHLMKTKNKQNKALPTSMPLTYLQSGTCPLWTSHLLRIYWKDTFKLSFLPLSWKSFSYDKVAPVRVPPSQGRTKDFYSYSPGCQAIPSKVAPHFFQCPYYIHFIAVMTKIVNVWSELIY